MSVECPECGKTVANNGNLNLHRRFAHKEGGDDQPGLPFVDDAEPDTGETAPQPPTGEIAPDGGKRGWRERIWAPKKGPDARPAAIKRRDGARRATSRKPADELLASVYAGVGTFLTWSHLDVPVGRVLQFQAPAAGAALDKAAAGGTLDRLVLQRMVDVPELVDILGLPILVGLLERYPEREAVLGPMIMAALRRNFLHMRPVIKKRRAEEREYKAALDELAAEDPQLRELIDQGGDPVQAVWGMIFAPPPGEPTANGQGQPEPAPDAQPAA